VASDPEELLRSIERTREELAYTVDTIAGRLDPKRAAKRGMGAVRDGVTSVIDGARAKLHLTADGLAAHTARTPREHEANGQGTPTADDTPRVTPVIRRIPKPAVGVAALVAFAAIVAARRSRR
jgi:hypothetical protein